MNESVMALKRNLISYAAWCDKLTNADLSSMEFIQVQSDLEQVRDGELITAVQATSRLQARFEQ